MSSSNFAGEKQRVAHSAASSMQSALEQKRVAMAKVAAAINNGNYKPATPKKSPVKAVKAKKPRYESDDDDFVVENSEEDEFLSDEEEGGPPKSKKRKAISEFSEDEDFDSPVKKPKPRTISESDSDDGWMSKKPAGKLMKTRVSEKKEPKKKKVIVSSDEESDFDGEKEDTEKPKSAKKSTNLLKKTIKNAEKEKKKRKEGKGSDGSWAGSEEEEEEFESTPDEDSEGDSDDGKKRHRSETTMQRKAREYFNSIKKDELENVPKMNPKILGVILQQRPFDDFEAMEEAICAVSRGSVMIESYMETMQNRNILQNVLEDCKSHAESVERGFSTLAERNYKPNILNKNMELHDYQKTGLNWLIMMHEKGLNCILADEMGLGKTIQVIAFLAYLKETQAVGPQLIVVPSSTLENWLNEFANWCPEIKVLTYYGSQEMRKDLRYKAKKKKEMTDVILTTYNMVGSKNDDRKFFKNYKMNYVIYDEGHMLKNCGTERYKNLMKIKGKHKILLTGTPLQNNLIELISLMYFTMTKIFTKYCQDIVQLLQHFKQQGSAMEAKTTSDLYQRDRIEQAKQILQPYILRRLKANVLTSLPNKFETVLEVEMIADQEELYEHTLELCRNLDGDTNNAYGALMRLRQAANHPLLRRVQYEDKQVDKIAKILVSKEKSYEKRQWEGVADEISFYSDFQIHQLCEKFHCLRKYLLSEDLAMKSGKFQKLDELLPVIKKKGDKVLIFSQFTTMLDILEVYMNNHGHKFKRLDGQTPVMERQEMINEYNGSSDLFVFLLSTRAGGLGINLTSANHIIIHDIDFNPYNDKQAEDRCHRMGQKKDVFVTKLISKGTVEVGIHLVAKKKLQLEKQVTTGIKGQEDENGDSEETRDSSDSKEEKIDKDTLNKLLKSAMKRKSLSEADDIDV
ncbi:hypothetical protein WR25_10761 [Diploscapter pachys]|uniref:SWI/SNF-related matrix-associated actin-dependent regulator of chromatin subfamily A containing DEAD/H box 1 homolog n=1 Tax=Diploscapter pachys TaxID=2018661 RepID=A0A2A2JBN7_9BILA|nr:hypothetical protein WR25_10761 [Diploscapter pachys]